MDLQRNGTMYSFCYKLLFHQITSVTPLYTLEF